MANGNDDVQYLNFKFKIDVLEWQDNVSIIIKQNEQNKYTY